MLIRYSAEEVRTLRWALNILAGASLLVFAATVTLWIRSYRYQDQVDRLRTIRSNDRTDSKLIIARSGCGGVMIEVSTRAGTALGDTHWAALPAPPAEWRCLAYPRPWRPTCYAQSF